MGILRMVQFVKVTNDTKDVGIKIDMCSLCMVSVDLVAIS